jgi:hypothetical protein
LIARLPEPVGCTKSSMTASASSSASSVTAPRCGAAAARTSPIGSTIAEAVGGLSVGIALIDGEAVVHLDDGKSDFHALMTKRGGAEAIACGRRVRSRKLWEFDSLKGSVCTGDDLQPKLTKADH